TAEFESALLEASRSELDFIQQIALETWGRTKPNSPLLLDQMTKLLSGTKEPGMLEFLLSLLIATNPASGTLHEKLLELGRSDDPEMVVLGVAHIKRCVKSEGGQAEALRVINVLLSDSEWGMNTPMIGGSSRVKTARHYAIYLIEAFRSTEMPADVIDELRKSIEILISEKASDDPIAKRIAMGVLDRIIDYVPRNPDDDRPQ
ncbi:MAG: hypothetical protein WBD20_22860, partial [Pirellulaceae bacterium]